MEIILLENIMNLGNIGDKVVVKPGYGRNYLLKTGKALRYSKENLEHVSRKKDELNKKNVELKNKLKETAKLINKKSFKFNKESKENGELYGSIKPKEISTAIFNKMKVEVKPSQIVLKSNLNKIGKYTVDINFHSEVSAQISIQIDKIQSV
jgi:large subunit ribosomal protein L9